MWIFFPFGFISVVAHRTRPNHLCVRARARVDLEALCARLFTAPKPALIQRTPEADYPYRIVVARRHLATMLEGFVLDGLDYDNFKGRAGQEFSMGQRRIKALHEVWGTMHAVEDAEARLPAKSLPAGKKRSLKAHAVKAQDR